MTEQPALPDDGSPPLSSLPFATTGPRLSHELIELAGAIEGRRVVVKAVSHSTVKAADGAYEQVLTVRMRELRPAP